MKNKLIALMFALSLFLIPGSVSAHNTGYCGFGSSGISGYGGRGWVEDHWTGRRDGYQLLMIHDYTGIWMPSDSYYWCNLH